MKGLPRALPFLLLIAAPRALAWPPTFGTELNFTNAKLRAALAERARQFPDTYRDLPPGKEEEGAVQEVTDAIVRHCAPHCRAEPIEGKYSKTAYRITFDDERWIDISVDTAVVEIQTMPVPAPDMKDHADWLRRNVFDVLEGEKYDTQDQHAHLNIGIQSAFADDPAGFLRFFVDIANHPTLGSGILGKDFDNAPPVSLLNEDQKDALAAIVREFNEGKLHSVEEIARAIEARVYTATPTLDVAQHYQAIGLKYVNRPKPEFSDQPVELRFIRQPKTADEYRLVTQLVAKRIAVLKKRKGPIIYHREDPKEYSPDELFNRFCLYLADTGLDWKEYKRLLPPEVPRKRRDNFVTGNIQWNTPADVALVEKYAAEIHVSPEIFRQTVNAFRRVKEKHRLEAQRLVGVMATWAASDPAYAAAAHEVHAELSRDPYWATHLSSLKELERPAWGKRNRAGRHRLVHQCRRAARTLCRCLSSLLTD